ncbi:MAG: hypothetical protein KDA85_14195, partial [Planctomycetaceae bacterium]|nr:hypothetical protein [Planctomycetaceae bacterium]
MIPVISAIICGFSRVTVEIASHVAGWHHLLLCVALLISDGGTASYVEIDVGFAAGVVSFDNTGSDGALQLNIPSKFFCIAATAETTIVCDAIATRIVQFLERTTRFGIQSALQ